MKTEANQEPQAPQLPAVHVRIDGVTAKRIRRLSERTNISENRIANMAAEAGIATVEKRFR